MTRPEIAYTEVRGVRFLSPIEELQKALHLYSPKFEYHEALEDIHQYHLFQRSQPSLIVVSYSPRANALFVPNTIITFTSYSEATSKEIAERFEEIADLELLTSHEDKFLLGIQTSTEEELFRELMLEQIALD